MESITALHAFVKTPTEEINIVISDNLLYDRKRLFDVINSKWETAPEVVICYSNERKSFQAYRLPDNRNLEEIEEWLREEIKKKSSVEFLGRFFQLEF